MFKLQRFGAILFLSLMIGSCNATDTPPVLKNFLVEFGTWDKTDPATVGSFLYDSNEPDNLLILMGSVEDDLCPEITFFTAADAPVYSPIDGVVTRVAQKDNEPAGDMSIAIKTEKSSIYFVEADHVKDLTVSEGDQVSAGDVIGKAAYWSSTLGVVELHVHDDAEDINLCPGDFLDPAIAKEIEASINQLIADVEELKSDTSIYDEDQLRGIGCYRTSIPVSELADQK